MGLLDGCPGAPVGTGMSSLPAISQRRSASVGAEYPERGLTLIEIPEMPEAHMTKMESPTCPHTGVTVQAGVADTTVVGELVETRVGVSVSVWPTVGVGVVVSVLAVVGEGVSVGVGVR